VEQVKGNDDVTTAGELNQGDILHFFGVTCTVGADNRRCGVIYSSGIRLVDHSAGVTAEAGRQVYFENSDLTAVGLNGAADNAEQQNQCQGDDQRRPKLTFGLVPFRLFILIRIISIFFHIHILPPGLVISAIISHFLILGNE
jgi:hypothetical protein